MHTDNPMKKKLAVVVAVVLIFCLGYAAGQHALSKPEQIGGTYVYMEKTLAIDPQQTCYYYADARSRACLSGAVTLVSDGACCLESAGESLPEQVVINRDGFLYLLLDGGVYHMEKMTDQVVRVDPFP